MKAYWLAALSIAFLPGAASALSTPVAAKAGHPIIPYLCSGGAIAELIYENGAGHRESKAKLHYDGHHWDLQEAPTASGLRYAAADGDHQLAWSVTGESAVISRASIDGLDSTEEEVARCTRLRGSRPGHAAADQGHSAAH